MIDKVKLDPNAGQDEEEVLFEDEAEPVTENTPDPIPPADETQAPDATPEPVPPPAEPQEAQEPDAPTEEEQEALEAAGVNIDEATENKARKRENKKLLKDLKELGTSYGAGKTSMINLAERITEAAQKKAISLADATLVYDTFRKAADDKSHIDDAGVVPDAAVEEYASNKSNEESLKAQIKKIEHFIELGNKFDETALDLVRRARNIHIGLLGKDRSTLKKGSTYTILVEIARNNKTRKESQGVMTDEELHTFLYVAPKAEPTPADEWKKVMDALASAEAAKKGGRGEHAREPITSDTLAGSHLDKAIWELRACLGAGAPDRLAALDKEAADKQAEADAAALKALSKKKAA